MEKSVGSCEPRQRWGLNDYLVYFFYGGGGRGAGALLAPVIFPRFLSFLTPSALQPWEWASRDDRSASKGLVTQT